MYSTTKTFLWWWLCKFWFIWSSSCVLFLMWFTFCFTMILSFVSYKFCLIWKWGVNHFLTQSIVWYMTFFHFTSNFNHVSNSWANWVFFALEDLWIFWWNWFILLKGENEFHSIFLLHSGLLWFWKGILDPGFNRVGP